MDSKDIILPTIEVKNKQNLSPFTWSNIKIPIVNTKQQYKPQSQKKIALDQKKALPIQIIKQHPNENQVKIKQKKQPKNIRKISENLSSNPILTQVPQPKIDKQRYRLQTRYQKLNKTIELVRIPEEHPQPKRIKFLDNKNNMQKYLKTNLTQMGWKQSTKISSKNANLLWSNIDKISDHNQLKEGQFYNHLNNSFYLTNKDKLHQNLKGKSYYPRSYLIPNEYAQFAWENNAIAIRRMLKCLAKQIQQYINSGSQGGQLQEVTLSEILQSSILKLGNQQTFVLIKMCVFLEEIRRKQQYINYFQLFQNYKPINITPKVHYYDVLIQKSFPYLQNNTKQFLSINYQNIDYRLLILILHYNHLFTENDIDYKEDNYLWIIKPIASSRGAGISIVKSGIQFCINPSNMWNQFKNKKKYDNKVIQRYIINPYLLQIPKPFSKRKFDIRQWVLVTSQKGKPAIYKYHTAYCRFSHEQFSLSKLNKQVHLTNYSIFKTIEQNAKVPSIMMLDDLFKLDSGNLRGKYNEQVDKIIKDSIISCGQIKYQDGCFQLFGFDFLVNSKEKIFLLEVNLNPACSSERHQKLKQESQLMTKTMMSLVTQNQPSDKWVKLYGPSNTVMESQDEDSNVGGENQFEIKPFYQYKLDDKQSLLAYIRKRNIALSNILYFSQMYLYKSIFGILKSGKSQITQMKPQKGILVQPLQVLPENQQSQRNLHELIHFVEENSVSNL